MTSMGFSESFRYISTLGTVKKATRGNTKGAVSVLTALGV